jgi:hypothetical protein
MGSSEAGRGMILVECVNGIRDFTGEKAFAPRIPPQDDFSQRIIALERKLATFVFAVLNIQSEQDFAKYATPDVRGRLLSRYKGALERGDVTPNLYDYLTLGECKEMILDKKNLDKFLEVFLAARSGFSTKEELEGALRGLVVQRDAIMHGRVASRKYKDQELLNIYSDKLEKCMDEYQSRS